MDKERNNHTFCWQCQDWKKSLGHSEIDCPYVICKDCGISGHIKPKCPYQEKNNNTWCRICQNWKRVLGHSQSDCPKRVCKNCELVGHVRKECPYPPKIKINTQNCEFSHVICENCGIVEHNKDECPYPEVRIVKIVPPRCEFCKGGHNQDNCLLKPRQALLNRIKRKRKNSKEPEVRVIGFVSRNNKEYVDFET